MKRRYRGQHRDDRKRLEYETARRIARQQGLEFIGDLNDREIPRSVLDNIAPSVAWRYGIIPLEYDSEKGRLKVAMSNYNNPLIDGLNFVLNSDVQCAIAPKSHIRRAIKRYYSTLKHAS